MNEKKLDKIKGAVYGFAIGDAMGATVEFMKQEDIEKVYGRVDDIIGGGWLNLAPGQVTDDTQMTLCVMDAIISANGDVDVFRDTCIENFIDWYRSNPPDVGGQCASGIFDLMCGHLPAKTSKAGNGSLMRALPCAIIDDSQWNCIQSTLTHNNQLCSALISNYTRLIQNLLNNKYTYIKKNLLEPTGYILNTYNNAWYWSDKKSFEAAIIGAVNHGGDADTIAAITGSIAGARFGYESIPTRWIDKLDSGVKKELDRFINYCERSI